MNEMKPFFVSLHWNPWCVIVWHTIHLTNILKLEITVFIHREVDGVNMLDKLAYRTEEIVGSTGMFPFLLFLKFFYFLVIHNSKLYRKARARIRKESHSKGLDTLSQNVKTTAALAVILLTVKRWSHVLGFSKGLLPRVENLL